MKMNFENLVQKMKVKYAEKIRVENKKREVFHKRKCVSEMLARLVSEGSEAFAKFKEAFPSFKVEKLTYDFAKVEFKSGGQGLPTSVVSHVDVSENLIVFKYSIVRTYGQSEGYVTVSSLPLSTTEEKVEKEVKKLFEASIAECLGLS